MENINLVRKIAWDFHHRTNISFEELLSEATLAYLEAERTYDIKKERGRRNWHQTFIKNALINFCKKEQAYHLSLDVFTESPEAPNNVDSVGSGHNRGLYLQQNKLKTNPTLFFELYDELSLGGQEITNMILKDKMKYITTPPKEARGLLVAKLRKQGWTWEKIWDSIREIKLVLKNTPENCLS